VCASGAPKFVCCRAIFQGKKSHAQLNKEVEYGDKRLLLFCDERQVQRGGEERADGANRCALEYRVCDEAKRLLIELTEIPNKLSRPFAAPPGISAARAQALQCGFAATHRVPQYLADAAKQRVDVRPVNAEQALQAVKRIESAPQQQLD